MFLKTRKWLYKYSPFTSLISFTLFSLQTCRGTAAVLTTASCSVPQFLNRVIPAGSQDELRWEDASQIFQGNGSSDLESCDDPLPTQFLWVWVSTKRARWEEREKQTERQTKKTLGNKLEFVYWSQNPLSQSSAATQRTERIHKLFCFSLTLKVTFFSVSIIQPSLRHQFIFPDAQCSMRLCFPAENCPHFPGLFLLDHVPQINDHFKADIARTVPRADPVSTTPLTSRNNNYLLSSLSFSRSSPIPLFSLPVFPPGCMTIPWFMVLARSSSCAVIWGTFRLQQQTELWLCNSHINRNSCSLKWSAFLIKLYCFREFLICHSILFKVIKHY